ncbi:hypothetical protein F2P81_019446 [Scophthalmus maximus]|uniref:Uncharacterized protein n=1 Tax=Scophthalmus maximus TaxID=52904 RepID=A0A6A4S736_SCOMX|nr:hypothetical protein F2P81_019446 [Scophthalmus maximus]
MNNGGVGSRVEADGLWMHMKIVYTHQRPNVGSGVHVRLPDQRAALRMLSSRMFASTDYCVHERDWAPEKLPNWDSRTTASGYDLFCIPAVAGRSAAAGI